MEVIGTAKTFRGIAYCHLEFLPAVCLQVLLDIWTCWTFASLLRTVMWQYIQWQMRQWS